MAFALPVWKENQELLGTFTKMWSFKVWEQAMQRSLENTALSVHDSLTGDQYTNTGSRWFQAWHQLPYSHLLTMVNFAFHQLLRREPFPMKFQSELLALVRFHSSTFRFFFKHRFGPQHRSLLLPSLLSQDLWPKCHSYIPNLAPFFIFAGSSVLVILNCLLYSSSFPFCPRILL